MLDHVGGKAGLRDKRGDRQTLGERGVDVAIRQCGQVLRVRFCDDNHAGIRGIGDERADLRQRRRPSPHDTEPKMFGPHQREEATHIRAAQPAAIGGRTKTAFSMRRYGSEKRANASASGVWIAPKVRSHAPLAIARSCSGQDRSSNCTCRPAAWATARVISTSRPVTCDASACVTVNCSGGWADQPQRHGGVASVPSTASGSISVARRAVKRTHQPSHVGCGLTIETGRR